MPADRCPHPNVVYCPLYHAAHDPELGPLAGCEDGLLDEGGYAVDRGFDYAAARGRLARRDPAIVAILAFKEDAAARAEHRRRNMRLNGVH